MVHGKNRFPYRIYLPLSGLARSNYNATIAFGCPLSLKTPSMRNPD